MRQRLRLWLPVLGWCAAIYALSSRPSLGGGQEGRAPLSFWLAKAGHLLEYGVLWRLCRRAIGRDLDAAAAGPAALAFCVLYGATDEWHQTFVPFREGRLRDVLIDGGGACLSWLLHCRDVK